MTTFETPFPVAAASRAPRPSLAYAVLLAGLLLAVAGYVAVGYVLLRAVVVLLA